MSNSLHGPYVVGAASTTGPYHDGGPYNSGNANNAETQAAVALNSFNGDLLTPFVSGVTCAKDGTVASQLDVASGFAYIKQTDGSLPRCDVAATTFSTTGNPSTTMYLDLNPDGSWSWATTHSAVTNHLTIASVTTDASANIATATDTRVTNTTLLSALGGQVVVNQLGFTAGGLIDHESAYVLYRAKETGASVDGHLFQTWDGAAIHNPFGVGAAANGAPTYVNDAGVLSRLGGQTTVGSFGAPVIVAQVVDYNMTSTALLNILVYAVPVTGHYRVSATVVAQNATSPQGISILTHWTDPHTNTANGEPFVTLNSGVVTALSGSNNLPTTGGIAYPLMPLVVNAKVGTNLTVSYNDPGGTPNDFISAYIERID